MKRFSLAASAKVKSLAMILAVVLPMAAGAAEAGGISGVHLSASVQFRHYELVKVLDGYFTLETESATANPYHTATFDDSPFVVVL